MKMLNNNLLCKAVKKEKNDSGLIIPQDKSYKVLKVVDVDESINLVKKEDTIYVPKNGGFAIDIEDEPFQIVNVKEIILIV